ncbi:P63C domain-containing protein [Phaeobacter inhibens]|uniref:P63C domain-containing protein n=1 Tax=Phaeobacter inhibens TaxID=221822 RepID=UPI0018DBB451|nr:P63C domain-containing protein [Phaeobacter inhibens]
MIEVKMSVSKPQAQGGKARAKKLTSEERRAIAKAAAEARWAKIKDPNRIPEAESDGILQIGEVSLDVYLLDDGRRVISKRAMANALGLKSEGGNAFMRTMTRKGIRSGLTEKLVRTIENPIFFKPLTGDSADGYNVEDLIEVCDAIIVARNENRLHPSQSFLATQAEIIVRSCAKIGIIALVDEAVGYIDKRKDEYRKLFNQFVQEEFRQWNQEYPDKFFDMIYKLYGLKQKDPDSSRHPQFFGHFIRKFIYNPLANSNGAILDLLDEKNPVVYAGGGRRYKLHQFLSDQVGIDSFRQHLWQVIGLGSAARDRRQFERAFYRVFPEAIPMGHQFDLLSSIDD